ncbi:hypothetical protein GB937_005573 [Aspergillus fischeri]|nr:hypothetical protein GB937_005573 [Aspergillus fischeri]
MSLKSIEGFDNSRSITKVTKKSTFILEDDDAEDERAETMQTKHMTYRDSFARLGNADRVIQEDASSEYSLLSIDPLAFPAPGLGS